MLTGKKILIGITGSIAAYKIITLVRLLTKSGAEVKIVQTPSSVSFVSPLVLSTLSKHKVLTDLFAENEWSNHVQLGRWADAMLVAPASCNTIAKMANGICDNLLMATYLSATCSVVVAPAMDEDMWHHPSTKRNLESLRSFGNIILDVNTGELASGLYGPGRMAEPEEMVAYLESDFFRDRELAAKKVLITAGPTYEGLDPVRFIGNHSSGKMGFALAKAFFETGADVTVISGPTSLRDQQHSFKVEKVETAEQMFNAVISRSNEADIMIMSAAVADYTPAETAKEKIKKSEGDLHITLKRTKDILKTLGETKTDSQILIGFALETENEEANALKKLNTKNADVIVLNSLRDEGAGFGADTNAVSVFFKNGSVKKIALSSKLQIARKIAEFTINMMHETV